MIHRGPLLKAFKVSRHSFKCCAGAIDGILTWAHKPSKKDCREAGCDEGKFNCSRKSWQILDISIQYPACTSNCLVFEGMGLSLHQKQEDGILAPRLCIFFGNNACLKHSIRGDTLSWHVWWDTRFLWHLSLPIEDTNWVCIRYTPNEVGNTANYNPC